MKRIICGLLICAILGGCALGKNTILKVDKAKFKFKIPTLPAPIEGEGSLTLIRQVYLFPWWYKEMPEFYEVVIREMVEGKPTGNKIEMKKKLDTDDKIEIKK